MGNCLQYSNIEEDLRLQEFLDIISQADKRCLEGTIGIKCK